MWLYFPFLIFRYNVHNFNKAFIHAKLAVGPCVGKPNSDILIPRIKFHPEDQKLPFEWQRIQFPVKVCFGITSNKSQGKTYKSIGINLTKDFFSHGQLYTALSRVGSSKNVKIYKPLDSNSRGYMANIVYPEILSKELSSTPPEPDPNPDPAETQPPKKLSFSEAKALTQSRLSEIGMKLSKEPTPEDGNCLIHGILDQMR